MIVVGRPGRPDPLSGKVCVEPAGLVTLSTMTRAFWVLVKTQVTPAPALRSMVTDPAPDVVVVPLALVTVQTMSAAVSAFQPAGTVSETVYWPGARPTLEKDCPSRRTLSAPGAMAKLGVKVKSWVLPLGSVCFSTVMTPCWVLV